MNLIGLCRAHGLLVKVTYYFVGGGGGGGE